MPRNFNRPSIGWVDLHIYIVSALPTRSSTGSLSGTGGEVSGFQRWSVREMENALGDVVVAVKAAGGF